MSDPDLFGWSMGRAQRRSEQQENLDRVAGKIAHLVMSFVRERGVNGTFHAAELHDFVGDGVAPASADRILRHLRRSEHLSYEIINRRASFYRITQC